MKCTVSPPQGSGSLPPDPLGLSQRTNSPLPFRATIFSTKKMNSLEEDSGNLSLVLLPSLLQGHDLRESLWTFLSRMLIIQKEYNIVIGYVNHF